jgi:predicted DNA-binding transcriptional regulator AlpA
MKTQTSPTATPHYLRASGTCKYFDIGESTLWAWVATRADFPKPIKASIRVTLFDVPAIERYLLKSAS